MIDVLRDFVGVSSLVLSHELAKCRIHRPCESVDITFFYLSRDRDIEVSRDFMGGVPSS